MNEIPKYEEPKRTFREVCKDGADKAKEFGGKVWKKVKDNKEVIIASGLIAVITLPGMYHDHVKMAGIKNERDKSKNIYDPRTGHHNPLRRKMTGQELREYDSRYADGESSSEILYDMGLLDLKRR